MAVLFSIKKYTFLGIKGVKVVQRNYAYLRVSSKEQNLDRQWDAIKSSGIKFDERDIYCDKESGKDFEREEWKALKRSIRKGDLLVVKSLDRFGRNKAQILQEWQWLVNNEIEIVVLDLPLLDTRKYKEEGMEGVGDLIVSLTLQILAWLAEQERLFTKQRQREGIESAKMRGVKFGRPKIVPNNFEEVYYRWINGEITAVKAMELTRLKKNTFYNRVKEFKAKGTKNN
ncbi:recombinase family protein [Acidilutibacter cellobiosedens]|uniref:Recombinase family protein n=1 Tax=Acidilutibacter cellobiosedens TaxID=2507161 RepID=A0A410QHQ3_9FIRM|nr:recombinase family protein [Acidilutibacter cellobiosedens]